MNDPSLIFRFPAAQSKQLIVGALELFPDKKSWQATSGLPNFQSAQDYLLRMKGPLPPSTALLLKNDPYKVSTRYLTISKRGIEGPIFPIIPGTITLLLPNSGLIHRDNFGIHFDANVPGSSGCIVLRLKPEFDDFIEIMQSLYRQNIKSLPLEVIYNGPRL